MGACCSCQWGGGAKFDGYYGKEDLPERRDFEDDDMMTTRGDNGARVRLQGSSQYVSMFTKQGKKGVNQDAMTVWENFSGDKDMFYCGVFDGHGPSGHKVSHYLRDHLPTKISKRYRQASADGKDGAIDIDYVEDHNEDGSHDPEFNNPLLLSWRARLTKCFHEMDEELEADPAVETYCSGTTSVSVFKKGEHLIISNLGDSRAVLCTRNESNHLISEQLTTDLKPNLPSEKQRITSCEGRVLAMEEEPTVYRVWMPDQDCPGLAMARAFGDFCLKDFGVISTPVVTYRKLTEKDEFVVLASDGIWDVLSNDEVVRIVASSRKRSSAAKLLIQKAHRAWRYKYPFAKIDDCAVICLFFKNQRASLTKSDSEVSQLSLNYGDLGAYSYNKGRKEKGGKGKGDELDTVLDYNLNGSSESQGDHRPRKRRPARKFVHVVE